MKIGSSVVKLSLAGLLALCLAPLSAHACAACYGQSDSPLAQGFNWGILVLLAVVVFVLGCISSFFFYLARRSAAQAGDSAAENPTPATAN